jgi:hypothetical protein
MLFIADSSPLMPTEKLSPASSTPSARFAFLSEPPRGLLDLRDAFDRVKRTDFWIPAHFLDERLKLYEKNQP